MLLIGIALRCHHSTTCMCTHTITITCTTAHTQGHTHTSYMCAHAHIYTHTTCTQSHIRLQHATALVILDSISLHIVTNIVPI